MFVHEPKLDTITLTVVVAAEAVAPAGLPVTWKVYGPRVTEDATLTVRTLPAPVRVGLTGFTVKLPQEMPAGRLLLTHDNVTD
jgi:hypothetical protein